MTTALLGKQAVVGRLHEAAIASLEDIDVADFDHVRADVAADRLDHALRSQVIETASASEPGIRRCRRPRSDIAARNDFESRSSEDVTLITSPQAP